MKNGVPLKFCSSLLVLIGAQSALGIAMPSAIAADSLSAVPLILTQKYDPSKEESRGFNEFVSSVGGVLAGAVIDVPAKVEAEALAKLSGPDMKKYFSDRAERDQIAKRIGAEVKRKYLAAGTSNQSLILATQYAANEIIRTVMNRVMEAEGARDPKRRALWVDKVLAPINACIKASKAYSESTKCLESFQADIGNNLGQAIGYELITQELGADLAKDFPARYVKCLQPEKPGADKRMMNCVLTNVRRSIAAYGKEKVLAFAKKEVPSAADKIVLITAPGFEKCLATAKSKLDFQKCADRFAISAGSEIAAEAVRANPQVQKQIFGKNLEALAARTKSNFATCMENNLATDKRDSAGTVETSNCANLVRYDAAKVVAYELFRDNIASNVDGADEKKAQLGNRIYKLLDSCWNSSAGEAVNNACLRKTVQQLVNTIADPQLAKELPAALLAKEPKLKDSLLSELRGCMESRLPTNMMEADDTNERVAGCTGRLTREAALKVAEFQFREILFGRTANTKIIDVLVEKIIKNDFGKCLGPAPLKAKLESCSIILRLQAGKASAEALIPAEFDRFVANHGGPAAYGLKENERGQILDSVLSAHKKCLDDGGIPKDAKLADSLVDTCFKATIKTMAGRLGRMEFIRSAGSYAPEERSSWTKTADSMVRDFGQCLSKKDSDQYSLRDYLGQVDFCRISLTTEYTQKVAQTQLKSALKKNLPSSTPADLARQEKMEQDLMTPFLDCVSSVEAEDANGLDHCVISLQKEATQLIAIDSGRERAKKVLNSVQLPKEISVLEDEFKACVGGKNTTDGCAKNYARALAKFLAGVKMRQSLADVLGKDRYLATLPEAEKAELVFGKCVDQPYIPPLDEKFLSDLDICSKKLEEELVGLMQEQFVAEMQKNKQGAEQQLNHDLAVAIPCFGDLMPATPIESAIVTLDPVSFLDDFALMIGDFIHYDVDKAGLDYQAVLKQLVKDMEAAGPAEAREKLLKLLIERGMVDRLLKSMVRARIVDSLKGLPPEDRMPPALEKLLADKSTVEKAITPEILAELRPIITEKILKPLLLEGKGMQDPKVSAAMKMLEGKVMNKLIESPQFGELIVQTKIQQNIDEKTNMLTRAIGRMFAGYKTFTWTEAREKPTGKAAEAYIRDQIILPRLSGEAIPDYAERMKKVSAMVEEALKKP